MSNTLDMVKKAFGEMMEDAGNRLGKTFTGSIDDVREYAAERALHLSAIIDQPGYTEAVIAERDNVAMRAGLAAIDAADAADREIMGMFAGTLRIAALALAGA